MAMSAAGHKKEKNFKPGSIVVKGRRPSNIKHKPSSARKQVHSVRCPFAGREAFFQNTVNSTSVPFSPFPFSTLLFFHFSCSFFFFFFFFSLSVSVCLSVSLLKQQMF